LGLESLDLIEHGGIGAKYTLDSVLSGVHTVS